MPRPILVPKAAVILELVGLALFIVARTTGAGWDIVLLCGVIAVVITGSLLPALVLSRVTVTATAPADATVGRPLPIELDGARRTHVKVQVLTFDSDWVRIDAPTTRAPGGHPAPAGRARPAAGRGGHRGAARAGPLAAADPGARCRRPVDVAPRREPTRCPIVVGDTQMPSELAHLATGGTELTRGVREYLDGDPIRSVHWPATARTGVVMVREYEGPRRPLVILVVDLRGPDPELVASRAAGMADDALRAGARVELATAEVDGPRLGVVPTPLHVGRRLARAVVGAPAQGPFPAGATVHRLGGVTHVNRAAGRRRAPGLRVHRGHGRGDRRAPARVPAAGSSGSRCSSGCRSSFAIGYLTRRTRPLLMRIVQSALAIAIMVEFLTGIHQLSDLAGLQVPLAQAFLWLLLLHALDTPNRHGLLVLLVASLVLVSLAGVLSISMAIAPWLLVWGFAALVALGLAYRAELEELPRLGTARAPRFGRAVLVGARRDPRRGAARRLRRVHAGPGRRHQPCAHVPVAAARRHAHPLGRRAHQPVARRRRPVAVRWIAGRRGRARRSATSGSRSSSTPSLRGRPDDTLVMRVRASSPDFWRGQTFDAWNGRVWTVSDDRPRLIRGGQPIGIPRVPADGPVGISLDVDELVQTYYLEQTGPNAIFAASQATKVYFPDRSMFQNQDGTLRAGVRLDAGAVYTVVSQRQLVTPTALRAPAADPRPRRHRAPVRGVGRSPPTACARWRTRSPRARRPPTTRCSRSSSGSGQHTQYSLDIPRLPKGADAVDQYVFVDRKGFCEQIGTTLVVMLRELGIPARLAVGYTPGERNPFTGLYEVKASDAHAWAEVYFPGIGWQGFDPTAQVPLAGDSQIDAAGTGALELPERAPPHPGRAARRHLDRGRAHRHRVRAAIAPAPTATGSRCRARGHRNVSPASSRSAPPADDRARRARPRRTTCAPSARSRPAGRRARPRRRDDRRGDVRARAAGPVRARRDRRAAAHDRSRAGPTPRTRATWSRATERSPRSGDRHALEHRDLHAAPGELGEERARHHDPPETVHTRAVLHQPGERAGQRRDA